MLIVLVSTVEWAFISFFFCFKWPTLFNKYHYIMCNQCIYTLYSSYVMSKQKIKYLYHYHCKRLKFS